VVTWICGQGFAQVAPRIENGRRVIKFELVTNLGGCFSGHQGYLPPPPSQLELDAGVLLPLLHAELRRRAVPEIRESEVVTLAKNLSWVPARTKDTLRTFYAAGHFCLVPRTINGRVVEMIELPKYPPRLV
jgi:hypothetical protein